MKNFYNHVVPTNRLQQFLMKLGLLSVVFLFSMQLTTYARAQTEVIALNLKNASLVDVLTKIKESSGYDIFYINSHVLDKGGITISNSNITVEEALKIAMSGTDLTYSFENNAIVISKKTAVPQDNKPQAPKKVTLAATVIDAHTKEPIAGATVIVKETGAGAITDDKGKFLIILEDGNEYEVSFIGMKPHVSKAKFTRENLIIMLEKDAMAMEDVIVTGYQTLSLRESASAVTVVNREDIHVSGASSIAQMLQGKIAGMSVMNTSGEPSATPKIRVRGNSTLSGNQAPVWVVDGIILEQPVPFNASDINSDDAAYLIGNAIAGINPQDIQTITVLKDASATAIYGVKAANGVIVITTMKGIEGRPVVRYSGDVVINQRPDYGDLDRMNSVQRVQLSSDIFDAGLKYPRIPSGDSYEGALEELYKKKITQEEFNSKVTMLQNRNTDWFKILFRTAVSHTHSLNVSGGTKHVKYYFSAGYNNNLGGTKGSDSERLTSMGKVDVRLNKYIDFTTKIDFNTTTNNGFGLNVNPFTYAYQRSRTLPAYNEDGSLAYYNISDKYKYNFINEMNTTGKSGKIDNLGALFSLNINLVKGLKYSGTFSYNLSNSTEKDWATERSYSIALKRSYDYNMFPDTSTEYSNSVIPYGGTLYKNSTRSRNYTVRNALSYKESFNHKHDVNVMVGAEARSSKYEGMYVQGYGWVPEFGEMFSPVYTTKYIDNVVRTGMVNPRAINTMTQVGSFFGSGTYSYDNRYILNANIRSDGANKFGSNPKYRWLPTWSVAGKWIITGEEFMQKQNVLDLLAIRGSYGIQGNIQDDATPNLIVRVGERDGISGQNTSSIYRLPNPDLRWEKTTSWNVGLDFTMLKGRISGGFDMYKKHTEDLIMSKQVSTSNGRRMIYINAGEMDNFGIEGNINLHLVKSKTFDWRFGLNLGHNSNEVTLANGDVYNNVEEINMLLNGNIAVEGAAAGSMFSYRYSELSRTNGYPLFRAKDGRLVHEGEPQLMELVNSGSIFPALSGGFDTQFTFRKRLTLSFAFTYNIGGVKRLPTVYEDKYNVFDPLSNVSTKVINRWKKPGDEKNPNCVPALIDTEITREFVRDGLVANRPGAMGKGFTELYDYSSERVAKSDYIRLRMISLNYVLPEKLLKKIGLSNVMIRFQANNLHVWASKKWEGLDPETPNSTIPILPSYSIGLNIGF